MRDTWERQQDALHLDQATFKQLLHPLLAGRSMESTELLRAGRNNTLYKITVEGWREALVLRIFQDDPTACHKEVELFHLLHPRIPLAELLWADQEGQTCGYPVTVSRWVEGMLVEDILAGKEQADLTEVGYTIGTTLATIGSYTFAHPGFFHDGLHLDERDEEALEEEDVAKGYLAYLSSCLFSGKAERWLGTGLTARLWSFVTEHAHLLQATAGSCSLVHADFGGSNLLVRKEGGHFCLAAVLDWEFAFVGSSLFDLGNLFRYAWLLPDAFETACLQGYVHHGGILPSNWKKITKLFDLINICTFLQTPKPRGSLVEDMLTLIKWTLEH